MKDLPLYGHKKHLQTLLSLLELVVTKPLTIKSQKPQLEVLEQLIDKATISLNLSYTKSKLPRCDIFLFSYKYDLNVRND